MNQFLGYLSNFSDSFLLALLIWPFLAAALTLPILIFQYRRYNRLILRRAFMTYLFILYLVGLFAFALYPLPDDAAKFCATHNLAPQLFPLSFTRDIQNEGVKAILQVVMNLIFFLPLGFFGRVFLRINFIKTLLLGLVMSLVLEISQLTGLFGFYSCSYRLFDVDDLMINTLGGIIGYILALIIPLRELDTAEKGDVVKEAGIIRHLVAFTIDTILMQISIMSVLLATYLLIGQDFALEIRDYTQWIILAVVFGIIPLAAKGWSLGGLMVRLNFDDKQRKIWLRILFYTLRIIFIALIIFGGDSAVRAITLVVATFTWFRYKKLPYQII